MTDLTKEIYSKQQGEKVLNDLRAKIREEGERLSKVYINHENMVNAKINKLVEAENALKDREKTIQEELKELAGREASITEKKNRAADDLIRIEIIRDTNNEKLDAIDKLSKELNTRENEVRARSTKAVADSAVADDKLSKVNHIIETIKNMIKGV